MRFLTIFSIAVFVSYVCRAQEKTSSKTFPATTLVNKIEFKDSKFDQQRFSCGFLLKHKDSIYAVTAKHLLKVIKPAGMKTMDFAGYLKNWSMYPLDKPEEIVQTGALVNGNKAEGLEEKSTYVNDFFIFSIKHNTSNAHPLSIRTTPLLPAEKLYVIGWTRKMESGPQRVYEFEYYKTIGNRILLKELVVPEQFGGLSGAPLVDEQGLLVGLVSNGTDDPETGKRYFSPCSAKSILSALDEIEK